MSWVTGVGLTSFGRHEGQSSLDLMALAATAALGDAGLTRRSVDGLVSRHGSDVVGCAQPSERSARRIVQTIPSCIGKRCNAAMRFDGQRGPTDDR